MFILQLFCAEHRHTQGSVIANPVTERCRNKITYLPGSIDGFPPYHLLAATSNRSGFLAKTLPENSTYPYPAAVSSIQSAMKSPF
jgi:hypothetical protein